MPALTTRQVARRFGLSAWSVQRAARIGRLPADRDARGRYTFAASGVRAAADYLRANAFKPGPFGVGKALELGLDRSGDVDEIAVERAVSGDLGIDLTVAERAAVVRRLIVAGASNLSIAERGRCSPAMVTAYRHLVGVPGRRGRPSG